MINSSSYSITLELNCPILEYNSLTLITQSMLGIHSTLQINNGFTDNNSTYTIGFSCTTMVRSRCCYYGDSLLGFGR